MHRFALWVEFEIHDGQLDAFLVEARKDAAGSVNNEPGCRCFDILHDPAAPNRVCFYEVYDDEAAFELHREMPHFKHYAVASAPMIASKRATRLVVEQRGKP